jgi:hypothetical protein
MEVIFPFYSAKIYLKVLLSLVKSIKMKWQMISLNLSRGHQFIFNYEKTSMLNLFSENFVIYYGHIRPEDFVSTIICRGYLIHIEKSNILFIAEQTKRKRKRVTFVKCITKNKKPMNFALHPAHFARTLQPFQIYPCAS